MLLDGKTATNENLTRITLLQYIKHNPAKFWLFFTTIYYLFLFKLHILNEQKYLTKIWSFLKNSKWSEADWAKNIKPVKCNKQLPLTNGTVVAPVPEFILRLLLTSRNDLKIVGLPIAANGEWTADFPPLRTAFATTDADVLVTPAFYKRYVMGKTSNLSSKPHIYFDKRIFNSYKDFWIRTFFLVICDAVLLLYLSVIATVIIIYISGSSYNMSMVADIFMNVRPLLRNVFPVLMLMILFYALFGSVTLASLLGSLPFFVVGLVNFFMLKYRNFPFKFGDIALVNEAGNMGTRYSYMPPKMTILLLSAYVVLVIAVSFMVKKSYLSPWLRVVGVIGSVVIMVTAFNNYYQDDARYVADSPITRGNIWNGTNRYMTAGVIQSFLNSVNKDKIVPPKGYTAQKAKKALNKYKSEDIPKSKRINVITIQLEAYADFSKYPQIKIDPSVYAPLKEIEKQAMSGELTTTIFGGGTVDTERKLVTGYSQLPELTKNQNSFVRYFNQQKYNTLAMHPGFGWFYNRQNIEKYLGFDNFLDKENYYNKHITKDLVVPDNLVFEDLYKQFKDQTKNGKFLFNQTVTYQNHGPYATEFSGTPLVEWKDGYNKADYAIINNYLTGVKKTNEALLALIKQFKSEKKPVVIAFYGDHKPWGGANNSTYKMLGVNLDQGTTDGYKNYFDTPYVMWSNDSAKKILKTDFTGVGPNISPMYILPEIFKHAGWDGSQYMQLLKDLQQEVPIFGLNNIFWYDDKFTGSVPADLQKKITEFKMVQYYLQTEKVK